MYNNDLKFLNFYKMPVLFSNLSDYLLKKKKKTEQKNNETSKGDITTLRPKLIQFNYGNKIYDLFQVRGDLKYWFSFKKSNTLKTLLTLFKNLGQMFVVPGICWTLVTFLIAKYPTSVNPVIVVRAQKHNWKLSWLMPHVLNVCRNVPWVANLCWPPPTGRLTFRKFKKPLCAAT